MKQRVRTVVLALILLLQANGVYAEDTISRSHAVKVGIGASINASTILPFSIGSSTIVYPVGFMNILIPVSFPGFRLEPEFGDFALTNEEQSGTVTTTERLGIIRLGLAAHYVHNFGDQSQISVGPRFAAFLINSHQSTTNDPIEVESSWTDILIGVSAGGEYLFSKHFSLGAEVQMNYISHGDPDEKPTPMFNVEESGSILSNNAALIVRWYFN